MASDVNAKIGLEIHVPLKTERKLFCDCPTKYYESDTPNTYVCPVCTGMPGSKPFPLNEAAMEAALMIGRLLECEIVYDNIFVKRKHYNYPDLPSGYQKTSEPLGVNGKLDGVGIWEVHIEEDPGRFDLKTGNVDYNRSGVPLIEIVTAPDMKTPQDVREFMRSLVNILKYSEKTLVDVGGVMRADVNISIEGGARVEIKNINSVQGAFKAIQYEIIRQKNMMVRGAVVRQETRGFNEKTMVTVSQRVKETEADYRYIPDPDIPPQLFDKEYVEGIVLPETPQLRKKRMMADYNVREDYASTMVRDKDIADLFEEVAKISDPDIAAVWICGEVIGQLNYRGLDFAQTKLKIGHLMELFELISEKKITDQVGKTLLIKAMDDGLSPAQTAQNEGLTIVTGGGELVSAVDAVLIENQDAITDYKGGNKKVLNYLMGQVMAKMRGRADQKSVSKLILDRL